MSIFRYRKTRNKRNSDIKQEVKHKQHLPDSRYPETRLVFSSLQFEIEIFRYTDIYAEYSMTILLQTEKCIM